MDNEGFELVLREQKDRVFAYAAMLLRDRTEAQDIVQEAMVRLWRHQSGIDQAGAPVWLRRTTHNLCIDRMRRRKVRPEVAVDSVDVGDDGASPGPERLAASAELGRQIERTLDGLSPQDRAVIVLREVQCRPYDEIAKILDVPLGTLKARLHRAREQMRKKLIRIGVTP